MTALAADIGGTNSRLSWLDDDGRSLGEQAFRNTEFPNLEAVIEHGRDEMGHGSAIDNMVLAVPAPVHDGPITLTNISWTLQPEEMKHRFGSSTLQIVNDFQAAAVGAINQPPDRLVELNAASAVDGPVVVTGAGTGLGMAWLPRREPEQIPRATEGGHVDFAPADEQQAELRAWLAQRYGHVSYERILSGPGLVDLHRFIAGPGHKTVSAAAISERALSGDAVATAVIDLFVRVFAAYAGNLALAFNPSGGIYLCGGVTVHLADWFTAERFEPFTDKGRMSAVAARIPVNLVKNDNVGLAGAVSILKYAIRAVS